MPENKSNIFSLIRNEEEKKIFQENLIIWGNQFFRPFPWRLSQNPYNILIAEIMLHRTQVGQVIPVYHEFIIKYPDINSLLRASLDELKIALWSLGLHWRIELMFDMTKRIGTDFNREIPFNKDELLSLPGVNEYITNAVRCFAWNIPEPIIDTNTIRIIGRLFNLQIKDSSRRNPIYRKIISQLVEHNQPRVFNYALLDLAHTICVKRLHPLCHKCPIEQFCCFNLSRQD